MRDLWDRDSRFLLTRTVSKRIQRVGNPFLCEKTKRLTVLSQIGMSDENFLFKISKGPRGQTPQSLLAYIR
jgi:hypothetical protein